jgi:hypothetical protein
MTAEHQWLTPSYSGGKDQEDLGSKPVQANSLQDLIAKKPNTKRAGVVTQGIGLEYKPWYCRKKLTNKNENNNLWFCYLDH